MNLKGMNDIDFRAIAVAVGLKRSRIRRMTVSRPFVFHDTYRKKKHVK